MEKVENTGVEKDSNTDTTATNNTTTTPALGTSEKQEKEHVKEEPTAKNSSTED